MVLRWAALLAPCFALACAATTPGHAAKIGALPGTDGASHDVSPQGNDAFVVLIFFSPECHVLAAHASRLRDWVTTYAPRGVRFLGVDSEISGSLAADAAEASRLGFTFPIARDEGAVLARALGAEYSGYTIVLDARGTVRYRGGLDSDRAHLQGDATLYLSNALADLLAGREPRRAETKSLGCALRLR